MRTVFFIIKHFKNNDASVFLIGFGNLTELFRKP